MPEDNVLPVDDDVEEKDDDDEPTPRQPEMSTSVAAVKPSALRQHVIDITKQWEGKIKHISHLNYTLNCTLGSKRVINMDNWYSSVQLCLTLSKMGLYCRGTVRSNRAHNPRAGIFSKKQVKSIRRGSSLVSVARHHGIVAVSWMDGSVVNMLSTADGTQKSCVERRVGRYHLYYLSILTCPSEKERQECLAIVGRYNKYMQGVDRHDQLREKFSIASGASFKHWYNNSYLYYSLCIGTEN